MTRFLAPLSGLFIFSLACGYLLTLIPLMMNARDSSDILTGLMGSVYFAGLLAGSFRSEKLVVRVGHIRSFVGFMALLSASTLGLAVSENNVLWLAMRFINGLAVAGIFVVVESWLLVESDKQSRGRILAVYMVCLYGAQALGQLLVSVAGSEALKPFIIIGILLALSILPPAMTRMPLPILEAPSTLNLKRLIQLTPSGMLGCFSGGIILGALYSMLPLHLVSHSASAEEVGVLMAITMAGGMALQFPSGYASDFYDRRWVLVAISAMGLVACIGLLLISDHFWLQALILVFLGGAAFSLYPLAISHGCDHLNYEDIVAGTQGLLLSYSFGACLGPVIAAFFMQTMDDGLIKFMAIILLLTGLFFMIRIPFRATIYTADDQNFIPVPRTTPVIAQIDPRSEEQEDAEESES